MELLLNSTTHCCTGYNPLELHWGIKPKDKIMDLFQFPESPDESHEVKIILAKERLLKNFECRKLYQKTISSVPLTVGDKVLLKVPHLSSNTDRVTHKFFHLFEGPYKISGTKGANAFILSDVNDVTNIKGTYNRESMRKYKEPIHL